MQVAVKHVRVKDEQELTSFCRELEVLSGVRHPHVLPFLGAHFKDPDEFWLVTEYMEGGTLASWLHPKKWVFCNVPPHTPSHSLHMHFRGRHADM
jgi:serine/threonine protein kinase